MADQPEQQLIRTLENLSTSVLLFDQQLVLQYLNPAAEALLEESIGHATGTPLEQLLPGNPTLVKRMRATLADNHPFSDREMPLALPGGRRTTVCCMVTPTLRPDRSPELVIEMVPVDRHIRIVREERLLTQNNATRSLLRGLAHEVKNPLGGLRGAAQLLEQELDNPELQEYTNIIIGEADRLRNLLDRMLGPALPTAISEINIHEALVRVQQLVAAELPDGVALQADYDPSLPGIQWNLDQLIQTLLNLVRNAAQAVGEQGTITLRTRSFRHFSIGEIRHRLVIRIEVIDDGPGIPPELTNSLFLPMVTGRAEGSGLGLSIAQTLVQRHGGLIECTSEPGNTNFSVYLPIPDARPDAGK